MKDNKNQPGKSALENRFVEDAVTETLHQSGANKNRFEGPSSNRRVYEEDFKLNRRYSFDDNGGGYLGL